MEEHWAQKNYISKVKYKLKSFSYIYLNVTLVVLWFNIKLYIFKMNIFSRVSYIYTRKVDGCSIVTLFPYIDFESK